MDKLASLAKRLEVDPAGTGGAPEREWRGGEIGERFLGAPLEY
jgi:hypothetical protein